MVHSIFRLHPERCSAAARSLASRRLHAPQSRGQAHRPPHPRARADLRACTQPRLLRGHRRGCRWHRQSFDARPRPETGPGHRPGHFLGSQIFDYWKDPWSDKHEHYCDGALFTEEQATGVHPASCTSMAQWGQAMPPSVTRPKIAISTLVALVHGLRNSSDVTLPKLRTLPKIFG